MPFVKQRNDPDDVEERYTNAAKAYHAGDFSSIAKAAIAFGLRPSSLAHRMKGRQSRRKAHEDEQLFSPAEERAIVKWVLHLDDLGFPPRLDIVHSYLDAMALPKREQLRADALAAGRNPMKIPLSVGQHFLSRLLDRNPILACKFASRIDRQRAYANDPRRIRDHFRKLGNIIKTHGLKPRQISNVDEKGFILGWNAKSKVLTRRGRKNPRVKQDGKREFVTALEAVSGDDYVFPSFLISKGKTHRYCWYSDLPDDEEMHFGVSPKGWTDDVLGLYWLKDIYDPCSKERCPGETRLLILDGHSSHVNFEFVEYCESNNIIPFYLIPHATHLLQPLDVGLFSPLQHYYGNALEDWHLTTGYGINRDSFINIYRKARRRAYIPKNIQSSFAATGIIPLNPRVVLNQLQAPGAATTRDDLPRNTHHPPSGEEILEQLKSPNNTRELRQFTKQLADLAIDGSPTTRGRAIFRMGEVVQGAFTSRDITNHAMRRLREEGKNKAAKKDMRVIGKGSRVLTVKDILREQALADEKKNKPKRAAKKTDPKPRGRPRNAPIPTPDTPNISRNDSNISDDDDSWLPTLRDASRTTRATRAATRATPSTIRIPAPAPPPEGRAATASRATTMRTVRTASGRPHTFRVAIRTRSTPARAPSPSSSRTPSPRRTRVHFTPPTLPRQLMVPQDDDEDGDEGGWQCEHTYASDSDSDSFTSALESPTAMRASSSTRPRRTLTSRGLLDPPQPPPDHPLATPAHRRGRRAPYTPSAPSRRSNTSDTLNRRLPVRPLAMQLRNRKYSPPNTPKIAINH